MDIKVVSGMVFCQSQGWVGPDSNSIGSVSFWTERADRIKQRLDRGV